MLTGVFLLIGGLIGPPVVTHDMVLTQDPPASVESTPSVLGWHLVPADRLPAGAATVPNEVLYLLDAGPETEPLGPSQWQNERLGIGRAWEENLGSPIVIAIVDSGIDLDHPDLSQRLFRNPGEESNGVDDDGNGLVDDIRGWDFADSDNDPSDAVGHGTAVSAVAAASLNGVGLAGVAPEATILPIRSCSTSSCDVFTVAQGIVYATDMGADVINLSVGNFIASPSVLASAVDYAEAAGVVVVAAAGNSSANIDGHSFLPAGLPNENLISVAATTIDDELWESSNWGQGSVDVGAPGTDIVTASADGGWTTTSGTSFAAPHVAGLAALLIAQEPDLSPRGTIELIGRLGDPLPVLTAKTRYGTRIRADHATVAAGYRDIHSSIFLRDIAWLASEDITRGCNPPDNDHYCPDQTLTRGEMAALLRRALDLPPGPDRFTDDTASIFEADINALANAGITRGCNPPDNDHYCPNQTLTRDQIAAFLRRSLG